jgi:hypothetical protein
MQHRVNGFWGESHERFTTVLLGLALVVALTSLVPEAWARDSRSARKAERWSCLAYGYGGMKMTWRTVNGGLAPSAAQAMQKAEQECHRQGLLVCKRNGCFSH